MARTIEEIEEAFREMGLNESSWGQQKSPADVPTESGPTGELLFIRIETTTTPLETKESADLA
jgi:hypothetical protein